jgi:hypothetical protein
MIIDNKITTSNCTEPFFLHSFGLKFIWIEIYCSCFWKTGTDAPWAYLLCCPQFSFTTIEIIRTGWVIVENNFIFTCIFDFWLPSANTAHHLRVSYWILFFPYTVFELNLIVHAFFPFGYWNRCSMCLPVMLSQTVFYNHWNYLYRLSYRWK